MTEVHLDPRIDHIPVTALPEALAEAGAGAEAEWMPAHTEADLALVRSAVAGNRMALDALVRRHRPAIERLCHRMCPAGESVDDMVQDVFLAMLKALPGFRGESGFLTWVFTLVRTCRGRRVRRADAVSRRDRVLLERIGVAPLGHEHADGALRRSLERAVQHLSALDREVLLMRDMQGYSASEVAAQTRLTVPAVKTRLHRARAAVRRHLATHA